MKFSPIALVLLLSFPVGNHAFIFNGILNLLFGGIINSTCNSFASSINNISAGAGFTCGNCNIAFEGLLEIGGTVKCGTANPLTVGTVGTVKGDVTVEFSGSALPPSVSADGVSGCLEYNPSEAILTPLEDTLETSIRNAIMTSKPQVCVTAKGKAGTTFALDTCTVDLKFGGRTEACKTCKPCGTGNAGFELDCSNVDFTKLILGPTATPATNLPAFPCISI